MTLSDVQACLCLRFTRMEGAKFHLSYRKFQRLVQFLYKLNQPPVSFELELTPVLLN